MRTRTIDGCEETARDFPCHTGCQLGVTQLEKRKARLARASHIEHWWYELEEEDSMRGKICTCLALYNFFSFSPSQQVVWVTHCCIRHERGECRVEELPQNFSRGNACGQVAHVEFARGLLLCRLAGRGPDGDAGHGSGKMRRQHL